MSSTGRSSLLSAKTPATSSAHDSVYRSAHDGLAEGSSQREAKSERAVSTGRAAPGGLGPATEFLHKPRTSGGFLLQPTLRRRGIEAPPEPETIDGGKRKADGNDLQVDKRRVASQRVSGRTSIGRSPLAQEVNDRNSLMSYARIQGGRDGAEDARYSTAAPRGSSDKSPSPTAAIIDPAQLVQMALNLSESRRQHTSGSLRIPSATIGRRVVSIAAPVSSLSLRDSSYRQYASRDVSAGSSKLQPYRSRGDVLSPEQNFADVGILTADFEDTYQFSPATLARAEKARKFFELSSEYRRLLQLLPPLKPDALAAGNLVITSQSSPGSNYAEITRVTSDSGKHHELGRAYNPLQYLRNRRIRTRRRRPLNPGSEAWDDPAKITAWIDKVQDCTGRKSYRTKGDVVDLPSYDDDGVDNALDDANLTSSHRRTDTVSSRALRPETDWSFSPSDLFADTYWVEQEDNKGLIENRHGNRIFPPKAPVSEETTPRIDEQPRHSFERLRGALGSSRRSSHGTISGNEDAESTHHRGRRRLHLLPINRGDSSSRIKRRSWNRTRSHSKSSASSVGSAQRKNQLLNPGSDAQQENTGPLARHIQRMLDKEAGGLDTSSPDPMSPDKWDSAHTSLARNVPTDERARVPLADIHTRSEKKAALSSPYMASVGSKSDPSQLPDRPRSSFETLGSTAPSSPIMLNFVPSMGMSLSPPQSRKSSPERKHRKKKFGIFRSGSKDQNKIEKTDFAARLSHSDSSRQPSGEGTGASRSSFESTRLGSSHKRSDSQAKGHGKEAREAEAGSAVSRFFKSSRITEIIRAEGVRLGEGTRKNDAPTNGTVDSDNSRETTDVSSTDDDDIAPDTIKQRPARLKRTVSAKADSHGHASRQKRKPKYYMSNLPTFKSPFASEGQSPNSTASALGNDPIERQQRAQRDQRRPSRFDRLAPPRIDISYLSPENSPDLSLTYTQTTDGSHTTYQDDRRESYGFQMPRSESHPRDSQELLGLPGTISRKGMPVTALRGLAASDDRSRRRPNMQGRRHWSISDRGTPEQRSQVTQRDIARVRALLLCSGIKAKEIIHLANSPKTPASNFLRQAAELANQPLQPVARSEEHTVAARMLSNLLSRSTADFEHAIDSFRHKTAADLSAQLDRLRQTIAEDLTPHVHQCADEADAFAAELSTNQTLAIKQVNDAIDAMFRLRMRRFKWVRRAGFALLEWVLLGIMWGAWAVVVLIRLVKRSVLGVVGGVKWMLWL
ncbi:hypothetical protein LTR66_009190 [Elasticomyces elasticus]|nr:hypothetical protein LTR66_009190 [Elasticomyces elasticus]